MLLELIDELLGTAPNDFIQGLYYVLAIVLIIFFMKVILTTLRAVFNIRNRGGF